jgi:hypothetical protein
VPSHCQEAVSLIEELQQPPQPGMENPSLLVWYRRNENLCLLFTHFCSKFEQRLKNG